MNKKILAKQLLELAKRIVATEDEGWDDDKGDLYSKKEEKGELVISSKAQKYLVYSLSSKYKDKSGQDVSSGRVHVLIPKSELGSAKANLSGILTYTGQSVIMVPSKRLERAEERAIMRELKKQHPHEEESMEDE